MEKEEKIVLAIKEDKALYLFRQEFNKATKVEFVVGYVVGKPVVGDYVDGWTSGHYFKTLEGAIEYLNKN